MGPPPVIQRRDRNTPPLAKLPPRLPATLKLLNDAPDVSRAPLFAHAAIFGQLPHLFKMGSLDAYEGVPI